MPTARLETVDEVILRWRSSPDADGPAGPLYAAGVFTEADIAAPDMSFTQAVGCTVNSLPFCSDCTASRTRDCC